MRMNLDDTWKNCLSMWRWIAKEVRGGNKRSSACLKRDWLRRRDIRHISSDCFFCHFGVTHDLQVKNAECEICPASKIDPTFYCMTVEYDYCAEPIAFYNKLVSLNRKRLKVKK